MTQQSIPVRSKLLFPSGFDCTVQEQFYFRHHFQTKMFWVKKNFDLAQWQGQQDNKGFSNITWPQPQFKDSYSPFWKSLLLFKIQVKILSFKKGLIFSPGGRELQLCFSPPLRAFQSNSHYWVCIVDQEQHSLNIVKNPHRLCARGKGREGRKRAGRGGRRGTCWKP